MKIEDIILTLTESKVEYETLILDEIVDDVPKKHTHRGLYHNTVLGQQQIMQDEFLTDEQKQKIIVFWGDPLEDTVIE